MKERVFLSLFAAVILAGLPLEAVSPSGDLTDLGGPRGSVSGGSVEAVRLSGAMGGKPGLAIAISKTRAKTDYAEYTLRFPEPVDFERVKGISFFAKSDRPVSLFIQARSAAGSLSSGYLKPALSASFKKFQLRLSDFKAGGTPDLTRVESLVFGFGLWAYDSVRDGCAITIAAPTVEFVDDPYIIPRPTEGVTIDGDYRGDWGYEDTLYNWTPPEFIKLVPADGVAGRAGRVGRMAFMINDKYLYLTVTATDSSPFEGKNPTAPWENDSVELFLYPNFNENDRKFGGEMSRLGTQIVFDCGEKRGAAMALPASRGGGIESVLVERSLLEGGSQKRGYILEAAIPLGLLPGLKPDPGASLGYAVKVNDKGGTTLYSSPDNLAPHKSCRGFKRAFREVKGVDGAQAIVFGPAARDFFWPAKYCPDGEKVRIWGPIPAIAGKQLLNGLWAVQSAPDDQTSPAPAKWFYAPVPMGLGWYTPAFAPPKSGDRLPDGEVGFGELKTLGHSFFWYERTFTPASEFRGLRTYLEFDYLSFSGRVYMNGKSVGEVNLARRRLEITDSLNPDTTNRLDVLVYTRMEPGISVGNGTGGITGDVWLKAFKAPPVIDDIWVKKASGLTGDFEVEVLTGNPTGPVRVELEIVDAADGKTVCAVSKDATAKPGQPLTLSGRYPDFKPWSPDHPALYRAVVALSRGGETLERQSVRFGFRTFEIQNGRLWLNGKLFRARLHYPCNPSRVFDPGRIEVLKKYGYRGVYAHSCEAGNLYPLLDLLDEKGMILFAPTDRSWPDEITAQAVRRYRNHPSVVAYVSDAYGQLDINGFIHNPFCVSDDYYPESDEAVKLYDFLSRRQALFRRLDPARWYFPQGTGNFKDSFRNIHDYPCYDVTLYDRALYFQRWAERDKPSLPLFIFEGGMSALPPDYTHPDHKFLNDQGVQVDRLIGYESGARYLGPKIFDGWHQWLELMMEHSWRGHRISGVDLFTPWIEDDLFLPIINADKRGGVKDNRRLDYREFTKSFSSRTLEDMWLRTNSWYYGIRALARWKWPEKYGQGDIAEKPCPLPSIFFNANQPFAAFIGGDPNLPYSLERNYFSGEKAERQLVLINDTENDIDVNLEARLNDGKSSRALLVRRLTARQGQITRLPFSFELPEVSVRRSRELTMTCSASNGETRRDQLSINIFPRQKMDWVSVVGSRKIAVVATDPKKSLTGGLGLAAVYGSLKDMIATGPDLLVIESGALREDIDRDSLRRFIDAGGDVLMFAQTDQGLLDWRARRRRHEAMFIADKSHPVVAGLDDSALSFWRGPAASIPREIRPDKAFRHSQSAAMETPGLTNEGVVVGYSINKPCYGNFHPILVCGYNLEEIGVMEARSGKGRVLFCQADVDGRYGREPAATILVDNLFRYMLNVRPAELKADVAYAGGPKGAEVLNRLGVSFVAAGARRNGVLVVGEGAVVPDSISAGRDAVIVLPVADYLPPGVKAERVTIRQPDTPRYRNSSPYQMGTLTSMLPGPDRLSDDPPPVFRGFTPNDLYFFEAPEWKSYSLMTDPKGASMEWRSRFGTMAVVRGGTTPFILCSIDPGKLATGDGRRLAWRVWSMIFSNLDIADKLSVTWLTPPLDISNGEWTFLTDPDGAGETIGFYKGEFGGRKPRPIRLGEIWETQGVTETNPAIKSAPDSAYDGFAWYFREATLPENVDRDTLFFEIAGVRDIATFDHDTHKTDLWINGVKMPAPIKVYNANRGGRAGRLWQLPVGAVRPGGKNLIAIRVFNAGGPGGIHRKPVRFEVEGQNRDMLFPYQFNESKFDPYYFWCW